MVGGTASAIGGGKFANGAVTGAFVMLFNDLRHDGDEKPQKAKSSSKSSSLPKKVIENAESSYGTMVGDSPDTPKGAKNVGRGLKGVNIVLDGLDLYDQANSGNGVNPITATSFGSGIVSVASNFLSKFGGSAIPFIGSVAGWVGTAIGVAQSWWMIYKPMNDLQYAPLYINNGVPYYGSSDLYDMN